MKREINYDQTEVDHQIKDENIDPIMMSRSSSEVDPTSV